MESSETETFTRLSFQECMELKKLPKDDKNPSVQRFQSCRPAWKPGNDLPWGKVRPQPPTNKQRGPAAFGGHVFAQAPLAAARAVEEEDSQTPVHSKLAIHVSLSLLVLLFALCCANSGMGQSIQGVFTNPGTTDRPFVYEVSNTSSTRAFSTRLVNVRQPTEPSADPDGPFPELGQSQSLGGVAFTCLTTFKRPVQGPTEVQDELSPQKRFASILSSREPHEWEVSPQADIDAVRELFPMKSHGSFPMLDMHKVDMNEYNAGKPVPERRQLILYRPYKPIPKEDVNGHIAAHAYEADRNGLIMLGNHLGYGYSLGHVASLSYSFYVHVNADEAVMTGDGWWVQEIWWPRVSAGRGFQEIKLWNPEGKHVASAVQDGVVLPAKEPKEAKM